MLSAGCAPGGHPGRQSTARAELLPTPLRSVLGVQEAVLGLALDVAAAVAPVAVRGRQVLAAGRVEHQDGAFKPAETIVPAIFNRDIRG